MNPPPAKPPRLRSDLKFSPITGGEETWYVIEDPLRHLFYRIGPEEYQFIRRLNHFSSLEALLSDLATAAGVALSPEQAQTILVWLAGRQLLRQEDSRVLAKALAREKEIRQKQRVNRLNLITFKLPLFNPDPLLNRLGHHLDWLSGPLFFAGWLLAGILALTALHEKWPAFIGQASGFFSPANLVRIWLIWFGLKVLHELFHAVTCRRYGGRVYEAGLLFILFIPLTYVNATSSWNFPSKWQRIHVAVAGMFIELGVAFGALLVWEQSGASPAGLMAHNTVIIAGVSSLLFNANPLMRFDGYYVLSDLLSIPNLYFQGLLSVRRMMARFFLGVNPAQPQGPAKQGGFIRFYGIAVYLWRILVLASLTWLASRMGGGFGIFIALGALLVWIGLPLVRFAKSLPQLTGSHPGLASRFSVRLALTAAGVAAMVWGVGWQERIQAPAVVEYGRQFRVRTAASGFVRQVAVRDDQEVSAGDLLLQMENNELAAQERDLSLRLAQIDLQRRMAHSRGRLTELQILTEQRQTLAAERQAAQLDLEQLAVTAPGGGRVIADHLDSLTGRFLNRGSELLWVVSPDQIRLAVSVAQEDIDAFRDALDSAVEVDMRAAGLGRFEGRIKRVAPAATTRLIHPALGAVYGGPLDVRQTALTAQGDLEQHYQIELFTPRFTVHLDLPEPILDQLRAGQTATVTARGSRLTLSRLIGERIKAWLGRKGAAFTR